MRTPAALRYFDSSEGRGTIAQLSGYTEEEFRLWLSWTEKRILIERVEQSSDPAMVVHVVRPLISETLLHQGCFTR